MPSKALANGLEYIYFSNCVLYVIDYISLNLEIIG